VLARRDYAAAWRNGWMTLAQLPVAGLLAGNHLYGQWVDRSQGYLAHVVSRLALARPAVTMAGGPSTAVMADVLTEDLVNATRAAVRDFVSLPAEAAKFFTEQVEGMVNTVLMEVQPDAKTDARSYVANELDALNRNVSRLREVAAAESIRGMQAPGGGGATSERDRRALTRLLGEIRALARRRGRGLDVPRERMLLVLQDILTAAVARFPAATPRAPRRARSGEESLHRLLERQDARLKLAEAEAALKRLRRRNVGARRRRGR
jgi:hypothetical protein